MAEANLGERIDCRSGMGEGGDWAEAAKHCLEDLELLPGACLGFVYVTDSLADQLGSIVTLFRGVTGVDRWIGTVGLGVCGTGREAFDRPAVSALLARFPENGFRLVPPLTDTAAPLDEASGTWRALHPPALGLIHADPRNPRLPSLLEVLADRSGFLVGGMTASRGEFPAVSGRVVGEGGVSGVLFSSEIGVATGLTQGCSPIGPVRTITECSENIIMEIDGKPALDVFKREIGDLLSRDLRRVGGHIFAALPIAGSDTGDYLVRNLVGIDPANGWIAIADEVADGQSLLFCRRDRAAAQADLDRMLTQMKRRLGGVPKGGVYISCVARGPGLFGREGDELAAIRQVLGDFPLTGFFANGEISNGRLYGYTGVLTLFT